MQEEMINIIIRTFKESLSGGFDIIDGHLLIMVIIGAEVLKMMFGWNSFEGTISKTYKALKTIQKSVLVLFLGLLISGLQLYWVGEVSVREVNSKLITIGIAMISYDLGIKLIKEILLWAYKTISEKFK